MTLQQFIDQWTNKPADFDGAYGNQCVDLFNFYNRDVVGGRFIPTPQTGGAADLWNCFNGDEFWDKVANTPTGVPLPGDVVIWAANTKVTGAAGHVAIFVSGDTNNINSFDQNYPTGSLPHIQHHDYTGVYGWLHPKKNNPVQTNQEDIMNLEAAKVLSAMAAGRDPEQAANIKDLQANHVGKEANADILSWWNSAEVQGYRASVAAAFDQNKKYADQITALNKQIADLKAQQAAQSTDITQLNSLGLLLKWFIARLGIK